MGDCDNEVCTKRFRISSMKIFFAWCCIAIVVVMFILLFSSAKDCKALSNGFWDFIFYWICDASEVLALMFIGIAGAIILFTRA